MGIKTNLLKYAALVGLVIATSSAYSVPVLQIGAPGGPGEGTYADYIANLTNPTESDTAVTRGNTLYVAGVYQNNNVLSLGGQSGSGSDWSSIDSAYAVFDGKNAILLAALPDDGNADVVSNILKINGFNPFYTSDTLDGLFPNNHDPLKDGISDYLFFDIGDFAKNSDSVPNFATETGAADGEIKTLTLSGTTGLAWIHFDVLAIETSSQGPRIVSTIENNPGSKDVTWKEEDDGGTPTGIIPEPATLVLLSLGLLALGTIHRQKIRLTT
ncbi:MAG: choice-of-anchor N protein [Gammaproteobacteria bacterium]|nr:choice-of-anchor N protein [Gammaproteobacteria bacterium]MCP5196768.1 choice-of-anchor N protein [Gammaproteobacteria bacterium]